MKLVALNGLLGYGYSELSLRNAFMDPPDFVGVDGGSSDPGPYYLGSGHSFTNRSAVKRDLKLVLPLALNAGAPLVVGTSGGSGSAKHLHWLRDIVLEIAKEEKLHFSMALIYTDVAKEAVLEKYDAGKIRELGPLPLSRQDIEDSNCIVSQIGAEPFMEALQSGAQVVLAGRACDTAIYAAPCLMRGYDPGLAFHMAKIMECGAMCATPVAAADVMQAYIEKDWFQLRPANPMRRCTVARVAAHTMYEQTNPYMIYEPDGVIDLKNTTYEQVDERTVRVRGSKFTEAEQKTLKLEGVRCVGFRTICVGGIYDPATIDHMDFIEKTVTGFIHENASVPSEDYHLNFRRYGDAQSNMCVVIDVVGKTQAIADMICALARSRMLHCDYTGRKSSAGNVAFPFSPSDIHVGEVYEFSVFHLADVEDLNETSAIRFEEVSA